MKSTTSLLPPEFLTIAKVAAVMGFFTACAMIIGLAYKGFRLVLGEERAKEYRLYFVIGSLPFILLFIYMFLVLFMGVKLKFWEPDIPLNDAF